MSVPIPPSKPKASLGLVMQSAQDAWDIEHVALPLPEVFVLAVRGYYSETIAPPGNNINAYDDACFIVSPFGFSGWNFNADPSRHSWNNGARKWMARLKTGVHTMRRLKHHASRPTGYMAFGQGDDPLTVERMLADGTVDSEETGCFGINLHRGGVNGTSSEGCVTLPPSQWPAFYGQLAAALEMSGQRTFPFILINGPIA